MNTSQTPYEKLQSLRQELNGAFYERKRVIDALLCAVLAKQHILLLGPPGTAKSAIIEAFSKQMDGANYFEWLLTKHTTPEELFGPVSLTQLQQDKFVRCVDGKLPTAHFAFIDECWKASSAILNTLLTLVNERKFHNGAGAPMRCPLNTLVGASNELPESRELEALFDRFAFRFWLNYLSQPEDFKKMLLVGIGKVTQTLTLDDLTALQRGVDAVRIPEVTVDGIIAIKAQLETSNIVVSDRRWRQILSVLKAYAFLEGEEEVTEDHFDLLPDMIWREVNDRAKIVADVSKVGNPLGVRLTEILDAAKETVKKIPMLPVKSSDKTAWLTQMGSLDGDLQKMQDKLREMLVDHGNHSTRKRKIDATLAEISKYRHNIGQKIASSYNL